MRDSIGKLTRTLRGLLIAGAVLAVGSTLATVADAAGTLATVLNALDLLLYLVTAVFFGIWIVRSHRAARSLGITDLSTTPGWALGFFFVPLLNLWRPYQAMESLWRESHTLADGAGAGEGRWVVVWWILWLLWNWSGILTMGAMMEAVSSGSSDGSVWLLAGDGLFVLATAAAVVVVTGIGDALVRASERVPAA